MPPSYLDIGMGGHFEGFGGCKPIRLLVCRATGQRENYYRKLLHEGSQY